MKFWWSFCLVFSVLSFAQAKTISVGIYDLPPHMIVSEMRSPKGAVIDFVKDQLFAGTSYQVVWQPSAFARTIKDVELSRLDMAAFVAKTADREKYLAYSAYPLYTTTSGLVVKKDFPIKTVKSMKELSGMTIGHDLGSIVPKCFQGIDVQFEFVSGEQYFTRNLSLLRSGRTQGFFVPTWTNGLYQLEKLGVDKEFVILNLPTEPMDLYVVFRKDAPKALRDIVDNFLKKNRQWYADQLSHYFKAADQNIGLID
jgi:ABC-type amino acid transport substrate-binding protein